MPSLIDLRRRIKSVKNTQQITKAMKMVAAAKLKRSQERIEEARPFAKKMQEVLRSVASKVDVSTHPLLEVRGDEKVELVVVTADRGLCGSFNTNIVKRANQFLDQMKHGHALTLHLVGRKGFEYYKRRSYTVRNSYVGIFNRLGYEHARALAGGLMQAYTEGHLDAIYVVYNEFKSVMSQNVVVERLLPLADAAAGAPATPSADYIYEPAPKEILETLLPKSVEMQIWRVLLESAAAEQAARMTAMDAATNNASDMIDRLTLQRNRIRQAAITREIIECVSGAEALTARS
ncbi:MAG: ATP synthase F1 subunit gamma [Acidobacteriota bacterium]